MTTVFQQAVQLIAVALGFAFLEEFAAIGGGEAAQDLVWKLLMAIAFIYLAGRIPSMLGQQGTFDAWLHTIYFGMSLPHQMTRSARSLGLLAGEEPPEVQRARRRPRPLPLQSTPRPTRPTWSIRPPRTPPPRPRAAPHPGARDRRATTAKTSER